MKCRTLPLLLLIGLAPALWAAPVRVEVSGGSTLLQTNVRNHLGALDSDELERRRRLERKLRRAVTDAAEALGYYEATFTTTIDGQRLRIELEPGERVRWGEPTIHVDGDAAALSALRKQIAGHPFGRDAGLNQRTYERYKRQLLETCQEYGFLDARYRESRLLVDLEQRRATPQLTLACGQRYRFGTIDIRGSELDPQLLSRLSPVVPGSDYRQSELADIYTDLQRSDYFSDIDVRTRRRDDRFVDLAIELTDAPSHTIGVGAGYGTDTGARGRLRWERPQMTRSGHSLRSEARISKPIQELGATYRIPLERPLQQSLNVGVSWEGKEIEDTSSDKGSIGLFYNDRLWSDDWTYSIGASYEDETYRQGSQPRQRANYLLPAIAINGLAFPEGIDPTSGHKTWLGISGSNATLGADTPFLRLSGGHKRLLRLGERHLLIARAELGSIITDDILKIPASQRFFTGGDQTVRGYGFESLSTRDAGGELIGGKYLNVASLEYSLKIRDSWRVALFTDSGRAFNDKDEPWHSSVGFGVRWLSPVGQIRVDLAVPVDDDEDGVRLHVFMGPPL